MDRIPKAGDKMYILPYENILENFKNDDCAFVLSEKSYQMNSDKVLTIVEARGGELMNGTLFKVVDEFDIDCLFYYPQELGFLEDNLTVELV